jgi:hypothetical protein
MAWDRVAIVGIWWKEVVVLAGIQCYGGHHLLAIIEAVHPLSLPFASRQSWQQERG